MLLFKSIVFNKNERKICQLLILCEKSVIQKTIKVLFIYKRYSFKTFCVLVLLTPMMATSCLKFQYKNQKLNLTYLSQQYLNPNILLLSSVFQQYAPPFIIRYTDRELDGKWEIY